MCIESVFVSLTWIKTTTARKFQYNHIVTIQTKTCSSYGDSGLIKQNETIYYNINSYIDLSNWLRSPCRRTNTWASDGSFIKRRAEEMVQLQIAYQHISLFLCSLNTIQTSAIMRSDRPSKSDIHRDYHFSQVNTTLYWPL